MNIVSTKKPSYRRKVWLSLSKELMLGDWCDVLILAGPDAGEVPVLKGLGVPESRIHVIDERVERVAAAHYLYPEIKCYPYSLDRALKRMIDDKVEITHANFDFCGTLGSNVLPELQNIFMSLDAFSEDFSFGVTWLGARDPKQPTQFLMREFEASSRLDLVKKYVAKHRAQMTLAETDDYQGHGSPMEWAVFHG